jgi:hypothetical protein
VRGEAARHRVERLGGWGAYGEAVEQMYCRLLGTRDPRS